LDAREVDAALCRDLITMVFLVPLAAAPPLADVQLAAHHCRGKQRQGREASLMSDQGSSSCLLNAPTCPASSQMSREATGLGLDSCEEDSWSTYPEGSQDLPMDNSCMLRIANKFYKGRAMKRTLTSSVPTPSYLARRPTVSFFHIINLNRRGALFKNPK